MACDSQNVNIMTRVGGQVVGECNECGALCRGSSSQVPIEDGLYETIVVINNGIEEEQRRLKMRTVYTWEHV